ncbi:MAG: STAS/SEC14 domain-containing protein [Methylococcales bacterium]|nr:STAS/SEC14 domain-containing protein [Methylococcales bacterium]
MITIMQESEGKTLVVKATESLTHQDYEETFIPCLTQRIGEYGKIRVVFILAENFTGMEPGAVWDDAVFGVQHRHDFEKLAVVTDKRWVEWATKVGACFMDGQVVVYPPAELEAAVAWAKLP